MGGEKKPHAPRRANRPLLVIVCLLVALVAAFSVVGYVLVVPHADLAAPYVSVADTSSEQAKSASAVPM